MGKLKTAGRYLKYKGMAKRKGHGVHSPFVFDLVCQVLPNPHRYYAYDEIEALRDELLKSRETIQVKDFGAGSKVFKGNKRMVGKLARHTLKRPRYAKLLFRLVNYFECKNILELGTSLGISTLYLARADSRASVTSMEGCPETLGLARKNFEKLGVDNIEGVEGDFDKTLPAYLESVESLDFVFFDGNHSREPTLRYFNLCLEKIHNDSLFVFDDIHWSDGMEQAWEEIKAHPEVRVTIDLFEIGLVFFRKEQKKEHFTIEF